MRSRNTIRVKPYAITSRPGTRAIRHSARREAVCPRPGAPAGSAQASEPAPPGRGEPLVRASIAIRYAASATASRNHMRPAVAVVVAVMRCAPSALMDAPVRMTNPGTTFASGAATQQHRNRPIRRIHNRAAGHRPSADQVVPTQMDAGQPALMPMSGSCVPGCLCAGLYAAVAGHGCQFRLRPVRRSPCPGRPGTAIGEPAGGGRRSAPESGGRGILTISPPGWAGRPARAWRGSPGFPALPGRGGSAGPAARP